MSYILTFLEGMITFISPCLLPMIPIYITYFAGQEGSKQSTLLNAAGFVSGFTLIFVALGAFAGTLGKLLVAYGTLINWVGGALIILLGLSYMGIIKLPGFQANQKLLQSKKTGFTASLLFGMVFAIAWTPCVGAFLGSALMLAAAQGGSFKGILLLLCYSLGLGIPFLLSAALIHKLKSTFDFIKRHYKTVKLLSGGLLVIMGILMATGLMGYWIALFS